MKKLRKLADKPLIGPIVRKAASFVANREVDGVTGHFAQYFEPVVATTDALRREVYSIRHQVYCEELKFEDTKPDGLEMDECDAHSLHCLIKHKPTGIYAGTVRVVRSFSDDQLLPIEKFCLDSIHDEQLTPKRFAREDVCEISRLAVPNQFRRRAFDKFDGAATGAINESTYSVEELRCFPFIAISLYLSAAYVIINQNIGHGYVMMEPRLARSMRFVGIEFKQIGDVVDYHGQRAAYYIDKRMFSEGLSSGFSKLFRNIGQSLDQQLP